MGNAPCLLMDLVRGDLVELVELERIVGIIVVDLFPLG